MDKYSLSYYKALQKISVDLPKILLRLEDTKPILLEAKSSKLLQAVIRDKWEDYELDYWKKHSITEEILKIYHVKPTKSVYVDKELIWKSTKLNPIFTYFFPDSTNIKVYRPLAKDRKGK